MSMVWQTQTFHVQRIENVLLEVRELKKTWSWRVIDGHDGSATGDLVSSGDNSDLIEAQGQCFDSAITFLDKVSPR